MPLKKRLTISLFVFLCITVVFLTKHKLQGRSIQYPMTKKVKVEDVYFGQKVADPYRWLEDDNAPETKKWVETQNKVTFSYLEKIPFRDQIKQRLKELWNYEKISCPQKIANQYFYLENTGLQDHSVLYTKRQLEEKGEVLLDPNTLSEDSSVSLFSWEVKRDGKYLAYVISRSGSDWKEVYVKDLKTKKVLSDHVRWLKNTGISWCKDGFYYCRYPEPKEGEQLKGQNMDAKIYFHRIGTSQEKDILVYQDQKHRQRALWCQVTKDEKFLVIYSYESTSGNTLYMQNLQKPNAALLKLVDHFDHDYHLVQHLDNKLYVMTNDKAENWRLICIDLAHPEKENWTDFIPEQKDKVLKECSFVGGKVIATYMKDAHNAVAVYDQQGKYLYDISLPVIGAVGGFEGDVNDEQVFYATASFTVPKRVYQYNIRNNTSVLYKQPTLKIDLDKFTTKQVFYKSKDGTKVPMFIVHKKGLTLDGKNPTLLYGYGGFNISLTPFFSPGFAMWVENGGIFALANIRGGGEYGKAWHLAGTKLNKQNVFDDFVAAGQYLIHNRYTSSKKLALHGGSNGGLLVAAVANQHPDLCKVIVPSVGVLDMLRYQKFTIGRLWAADYGTSEDSQEMFEYLYQYSPLHRIPEGRKFPATLVTTADHDDRVVPAHSFKYIATLQEKYSGPNPTLIRIESKAGHSAGTSTTKQIELITDLYSFLFYNLKARPKKLH